MQRTRRYFRPLYAPTMEGNMASNSKQTKFRRELRRKKAGRDNKRSRRNQGTTPVFPIHTAEADANAPQYAKKTDTND